MITIMLFAILVVVFVIAPIYLVRLHKRMSNRELLETERRYRLDNPDFAAMRKYLKAEIPYDIIELYKNKNVIGRTDFEIVDPLDRQNIWEIESFIPADPRDYGNLMKKVRDKFCFAESPYSGTYYVDIKSGDPTVYIYYQFGDKIDVVAPSIQEFLRRLRD